MSGTFSVCFTQQFDIETSEFLSGGLLSVYQANTSTPVSVFTNSALTLDQSNPVELDSGGRIPAVWADDGNYRLVLRNSDGVTQFDITSTPALGASTATESSSSSGTSVDSNSLIKTGYPLWLPVAGTLTGFVRMNGRTISSGSGAGSERANADCQDLFLYAWTNFTDAQCAVGGGRGATAAADWAANKAIATFDMRDACPYGMSGMGNTDFGDLSNIAGGQVGQLSHSINVANLPSYNLSAASLTGSVGTAITKSLTVSDLSIANGTTVRRGTGTADIADTGSGTVVPDQGTTATLTLNSGTVGGTATLTSGTVTFGGNVPSGGSGTAFDTTSYGIVGSWYWKL